MKCKTGYRLVEGKCVKKFKVFKGISISNPFKKIGPWIGFVLGLGIIFAPVLQGNFPGSTIDDYSLWKVIVMGASVSTSGWIKLIGWTVGSAVVGFVMGWAVQGLIHKFRK
jgi:hypothetical protein